MLLSAGAASAASGCRPVLPPPAPGCAPYANSLSFRRASFAEPGKMLPGQFRLLRRTALQANGLPEAPFGLALPAGQLMDGADQQGGGECPRRSFRQRRTASSAAIGSPL